jgi:hypothetical protein
MDWAGPIRSGLFAGSNAHPFFGFGRSWERCRLESELERGEGGGSGAFAMDAELFERGFLFSFGDARALGFRLREVYLVQQGGRIDDLHGMGRQHSRNWRWSGCDG